MLVTEATNQDNGYGRDTDQNSHKYKILYIWAKFYHMHLAENVYGFPSWDEVKEVLDKKDTPEQTDQIIQELPPWAKMFNYYKANAYTAAVYINHHVYKLRIRLIIEPFLAEANERAKAVNKRGYIHAIGLGLGVWQICPDQANWMVEVYSNLLSTGDYDFIDIIDFSWFPDSAKTFIEPVIPRRNKENNQPIEIRFSKRDPAEKLEDQYILIAMYAWDGNSYPGNEYWRGMLHASGDPAAACCSTIAELQNPEINKDFVHRIETYGAKL